jgi:hypothetical protein
MFNTKKHYSFSSLHGKAIIYAVTLYRTQNDRHRDGFEEEKRIKYRKKNTNSDSYLKMKM